MLRGRRVFNKIIFAAVGLIGLGLWSDLAFAQFPVVSSWKFRKGYFVLSSNLYSGAMGGLVGANALCLADLLGSDWLGKAQAQPNLIAGKVRAFLCDGATCNNPLPNAYYFFASTDLPTSGGAHMKISATGQGPNNASNWSSANHFDWPDFTWTGRGVGIPTLWAASGTASHCANWTSGAGGQQGFGGDTNATNAARWNDGVATPCNSTLYLICMVDP